MAPLIDVTNTVTDTTEFKIDVLIKKDIPKVEKESPKEGKIQTVREVKKKHRKSRRETKDSSQVKSTKSEGKCHCERVPPLPTVDFISSAVKTLNLSKNILLTEDHKLIVETKQIESSSSCDKNNPEESSKVSNTHQCVACQLQFSTVDNLTKHLMKHIMDGLHAATWLSNAMATLLPNNENASSIESINR